MLEEKNIFSVYVLKKKESVERRLMFLLHSKLHWMHCNHFFFAKQFLCAGTPVRGRKKPVVFWTMRNRMRKRCD